MFSAEGDHPARKRRQRENYQYLRDRSGAFRAERSHFTPIPALVRQHPNSPIPLLSEIEWSEETKKVYPIPDSIYLTIGGVCWPMVMPDEGLTGMAVLFGLDLRTGVVWLLGERKFITVERTEDYPVDAPAPLRGFLRVCMDFFRVKHFYQCQAEAVMKKFTPSIIRAFPKPPRPSFITYRWNDLHTSMQTFYEYIALDRFKFFDSRLWFEMRSYDALPDGDYPALHAACVCLAGLDRLINSEYSIQQILRKIDG